MATKSRSSASSTLDIENDTKDKDKPVTSSTATEAFEQSNVVDPEKASSADSPNIADEHEYVTGIKLVLILAAVTLVYFLIMLDGSIVATV